MKNFFSKYWPSLAHAAAVSIVFVNPSVQALALANPKLSAVIGLVWGFLLHWATSPKQP